MAHASYRIFLVDDHAVVRQGTRDILNAHPQLEVCGEKSDGADLLGELSLRAPDLLLLDINLPEVNGLQLFEKVRQRLPSLPIVFFSAHTDTAYLLKARHLKADGYLSKTLGGRELQEAVLLVLGGHGPVYCDTIAQRLQQATRDSRQANLTPRETEILLEVAHGKTNQAISAELYLSVKTVDTHVANIMRKIGVNSRSQLTAYTYEQGLL